MTSLLVNAASEINLSASATLDAGFACPACWLHATLPWLWVELLIDLVSGNVYVGPHGHIAASALVPSSCALLPHGIIFSDHNHTRSSQNFHLPKGTIDSHTQSLQPPLPGQPSRIWSPAEHSTRAGRGQRGSMQSPSPRRSIGRPPTTWKELDSELLTISCMMLGHDWAGEVRRGRDWT